MPKPGYTCITISKELYEKLKRQAKARGRSIPSLIEWLLRAIVSGTSTGTSTNAEDCLGNGQNLGLQAVARGRFELPSGAPKVRNLQRVSYELLATRILEEFRVFLKVNLRRSESTVKDHIENISRFLKFVNKPICAITAKDIQHYLMLYDKASINTYRNQLKALRIFFRDFLKSGLANDFRFPTVPITIKPELPKREELRRFCEALLTLRDKAIFLLLATSGLRIGEVLSLKLGDIDLDKRMIKPNSHTGNTKKSWVSFFNEEARQVLQAYLRKRGIVSKDSRVFEISLGHIERVFRQVGKKVGVDIKPKTLRDWFCSEMGRLGVPDRYVDAFCGRVPRSVLARHYTDFSPELLKQIYDKAGLKVLA